MPGTTGMNKYILVGDPHVKKDNVEESERLIDWIEALCNEHGARPIFMGDQSNDHGTPRVEVIDFWDRAFTRLGKSGAVYALIGNHDMNHECTASVMRVYRHIEGVVPIGTDGYTIDQSEHKAVYGLGYFKSNEDFIESLNRLSALSRGRKAIVLCHQEFNGADYGNGYFSPHGVDPDLVPENIQIISGHIHQKQFLTRKIDNKIVVHYIGTPRQLSISEAGDQKLVYLVEFEGDTKIQAIAVPDTVCEQYREYTISPDGPPVEVLLPEIKNSTRVLVNISGSREFIKSVSNVLPESVRTRTFPVKERSEIKVKESEGVPKAFVSFGKSYFDSKAIDEDMRNSVLKKVFEKCPSLRG
jgi:DNA repair exonuclease SbcCD nuclease subunit